ncbi:hypothetical protein J6590_078336 [Homalodisca vitripennis]|nr:hypothetical protein J6590_078336 [Homalodisca vitripennis]
MPILTAYFPRVGRQFALQRSAFNPLKSFLGYEQTLDESMATGRMKDILGPITRDPIISCYKRKLEFSYSNQQHLMHISCIPRKDCNHGAKQVPEQRVYVDAEVQQTGRAYSQVHFRPEEL